MRKKLSVKGYASYVDMINKEVLDFVIIATPHWTHKKIIEDVAEKGIHILKEKPFAENLKDAFEIKKVCDCNKIKLMITLQEDLIPYIIPFFN